MAENTAPQTGMPPAPAALSLPAGTTAEEVAALVAVLAAAGGSGTSSASGPRSRWADHTRTVRAGLSPGRGAWRAAALPR